MLSHRSLSLLAILTVSLVIMMEVDFSESRTLLQLTGGPPGPNQEVWERRREKRHWSPCHQDGCGTRGINVQAADTDDDNYSDVDDDD